MSNPDAEAHSQLGLANRGQDGEQRRDDSANENANDSSRPRQTEIRVSSLVRSRECSCTKYFEINARSRPTTRTSQSLSPERVHHTLEVQKRDASMTI
jgi:hypothetical protein